MASSDKSPILAVASLQFAARDYPAIVDGQNRKTEAMCREVERLNRSTVRLSNFAIVVSFFAIAVSVYNIWVRLI
jgi:hypothetical protein